VPSSWQTSSSRLNILDSASSKVDGIGQVPSLQNKQSLHRDVPGFIVLLHHPLSPTRARRGTGSSRLLPTPRLSKQLRVAPKAALANPQPRNKRRTSPSRTLVVSPLPSTTHAATPVRSSVTPAVCASSTWVPYPTHRHRRLLDHPDHCLYQRSSNDLLHTGLLPRPRGR
jgi:hypothetical protein